MTSIIDRLAAEGHIQLIGERIIEPSKPLVGVYIIVKNEAKNLPRLLRSIEGAFDEYVFVDTGSTDETREIIAKWFPGTLPLMPSDDGVDYSATAEGKTYVLKSFDWVDDFAAARNFAYSLGTAKWRGFLDADDEVENAASIRKLIEHMEVKAPHANTLSLKYIYRPNALEQDIPFRFVRWADGWEWQDELHEYLAPKGRRVVYKPMVAPKGGSLSEGFTESIDVPVVHHRKPDAGHATSAERNIRIIHSVFQKGIRDETKEAKFLYHLMSEHLFLRDLAKAVEVGGKLFDHPTQQTYTLLAYEDIIVAAAEQKDFKLARVLAGRFVAAFPEHALPYRLMGYVLARQGEWVRAVMAFENGKRGGTPTLQASHDVLRHEGVIPAWEALAYAHTGNFREAERALQSTREAVRPSVFVKPVLKRVIDFIERENAVARTLQMAEAYIADVQPLHALDVLEAPLAVAAGDPRIKAKIDDLVHRLRHTESFEQYVECYQSIPDETFHTKDEHVEEVLDLDRARTLIGFFESKSGDTPMRMLSIGFQDGYMEEKCLDLCPNLELDVVDVAPKANKGLQRLVEKFGERVKGHKLETMYGWPRAVGKKYDVIVMFEVIEHVPSPVLALFEIADRLADDGTFFMSTPVPSQWIEQHLNQPPPPAGEGPSFYGHLNAWNHVQLSTLLGEAGFDGDIVEGLDGTYVCQLRKCGPAQKAFAIFVPGTPKPFDGLSHERGFVGGSEECVIHLARHLVKLGHEVQVFAPTLHNDDGVYYRQHEGVLWRDVSEFYAKDTHFDAVFFWRCPQVAASPTFDDVPYKKILWLHDAYYGAPAAYYEKMDKVVVLSGAHRDSLVKHDLDGAVNCDLRQLANGIDKGAFPPLTEKSEKERDPFHVLYTSSPDRGLSKLLAMWPAIKQLDDRFRLTIAYDWTVYLEKKPEEASTLLAMVDALSVKESVELHLQGLPHGELHALMRKAGLWLYPCTDDEVETFCITAVKMSAAGVYSITSSAGALKENVYGSVLSMNAPTEHWLQAIKKYLRVYVEEGAHHEPLRCRQDLREWALKHFAWSKVAKDFANLVEEQ